MTRFTMKEYMLANKIPGSPHDPNINRLLREHFKDMGLVKVRRRNRMVWIPAEEALPKDYDKVKAQLEKLK